MAEITFTPEEQHKFEEEASIYAIIRTVAQLEKAWINEKVDDNDYQVWCKKLIAQYSSLTKNTEFPGLDVFMTKYGLSVTCRLAKERLELGKSGLEGTGTHQVHKAGAQKIIEATQNFITAKDALALGYKAVDQIQPLVQEIVASLSETAGLGQGFEGANRIRGWLGTFANMRANEELSEEQIRQLNFDIDNAFNEFKQASTR
jgi:ESCRT-I complex subunit VPS28